MSTTGSTTEPRRVVAEISLSLDGRYHGPDGPMDMSWVAPHANSEAARDRMLGFMTTATTILMGRTNAEGFAGYWPPVAHDPAAGPHDRAISLWLSEVDKIVFTSRPHRPTGWPDAEHTDIDPPTLVRNLRVNGDAGEILALSSASVIRQLLAADLVDRISLRRCPVIVGSGPRLMDDLPLTNWRPVTRATSTTGAAIELYDRDR